MIKVRPPHMRLGNIRDVGIQVRLIAAFGLMVVVAVVVTMTAVIGINRSNASLTILYEDSLVPTSQIARIDNLMKLIVQQLIVASISDSSSQNIQRYVDRVEDYNREIDSPARPILFHEQDSRRPKEIIGDLDAAKKGLRRQGPDADDRGIAHRDGKRRIIYRCAGHHHGRGRPIEQSGASDDGCVCGAAARRCRTNESLGAEAGRHHAQRAVRDFGDRGPGWTLVIVTEPVRSAELPPKWARD